MSFQDTPVADLLLESAKSSLPAAAQKITEKQAVELNNWLRAGKEGPIPVSDVDMADLDALADAWDNGAAIREGALGVGAAAACCCSIVCCCCAAAQVDSIRSRSIL